MLAYLARDIENFNLVRPEKGFFKYLYYPGFRCVVLFRFSQSLYRRKLLRPLAYVLTTINEMFMGVWIGPRVRVGPGLFLGHPRGLVINPGTVIGENCAILQRVTIGGPDVTIGDNVEIDSSVSIISNPRKGLGMRVGDSVIIGAGTVVVKDVPSNSVVVGVPARVVRRTDPGDSWVEWRRRKLETDS